MLNVPTPQFLQDDQANQRLAAAKPMTLTCGPVTFPDGSHLTVENATASTYLLYRESPAGVTSIWNEQTKLWVPESAPAAGQPLMYQEPRWQTILVAAGAKDAGEADKLAPAGSSEFPRFYARCFFRGKDQASGMEHVGESPPTQTVTLVAPGEDNRAGAAVSPSPESATDFKLFLKDSGLTERGSIAIRSQAGGFVIELRTGFSSVTLASDGSISLVPGGVLDVVNVAGDLAVSGAVRVNGVQLNVP